MAQQTILFTVMPRGMSLNADPLPLSIYVSPRLTGDARLGSYPDWLHWTGRLKADGLAFTLRCGTRTITRPIDTEVLQPRLWDAMFAESTFVRSHAAGDYSDRTIFSYPTRVALSTLKDIYQQAGVVLGLPDRGPVQEQERGDQRRRYLKGLLAGLEINWTEKNGERLRTQYRDAFSHVNAFTGVQARYQPGQLAADGTILPPANAQPAAVKARNQFLATQFGLYTHMPQGALIEDHPPDFDTLIDFHQALSALNSYPDLLRALGLVFDLEVPADFADLTPFDTPGRLAVVGVEGAAWAIATKVVPDLPPLETAYLHLALGAAANPARLFTTAPGVLGGALPELEIFGLLTLFPTRYGIAQVDVESGMHKTTRLAESWQDGRPGPAPPDRPDVFDETTTLPALRSGGLSVFADGRALRLLTSFKESRKFNDALAQGSTQARPFHAEDLVHGYRIDIWDSRTGDWHSLHRRHGAYRIEDELFETEDEEGFTQLAAAQPAPDPAAPPPNDLYLNESVARWAGWSLSVPFPGKVLSRDPDPAKALTDDPAHPPNEPATPFKMTTAFRIATQSLPSLRFGRRYRLRVRPVDICGNSLDHDAPLAHLLSLIAGLPLDPEGFAYLRYEPVVAPTLVLRDARGVTGPGSQLERLVIRTFNASEAQDASPADLTASDRFVAPPGTSVEMAERLGMFDDPAGRIVSGAAMHALIGQRDKERFSEVSVEVAGQTQKVPIEAADAIDALPYLPDVLARGAALRDLPGLPEGTLASVAPGAGAEQFITPELLGDANPRSGSATLVGFGGDADWQDMLPFRLALADGGGAPARDAAGRVLTVFLPKGAMHVVPLSSYLRPDDLKWMGVWQWLREYIDHVVVDEPAVAALDQALDSERIAHLLQRATEGGHWMITPPKLLTLVHAVQQPIGRPAFTAINVQREPYGTVDKWKQIEETVNPDPGVLQTMPEEAPTPAAELAPITAWRKPGSDECFLLGGLKVHVESTGKIDVLAEWADPFDDATTPRLETEDYTATSTSQVDEVIIPTTSEAYLDTARGTSNHRYLGYFDADQDVLCFVRAGDRLGSLPSGVVIHSNAAPRHHLNDTKHHRVRYRARATSRFQEYFAKEDGLDFTRTSDAVDVDVPASERPAAPQIDYVVPTFGWQRQTQTNVKRSVRFGGGLRVYLQRPWFSSGAGELLGVALYDFRNGWITDREAWKPFITQWGVDPIWSAPGLTQLPDYSHFPNAAAREFTLSVPGRAPGLVGVVGFPVSFDYGMQRWFADVTIDVQTHAYCPFIRLALVRYQPYALPDAKLSAVALADFAQLTPERSAVVTADPYHPRRLKLTVSGPAPAGPAPVIVGPRPTTPVNVPSRIVVSVEERDATIQSDLGWKDAPAAAASIVPQVVVDPTGLVRWTGAVTFATTPAPGRYRLVIREYEYLSANYTEPSPAPTRPPTREQPKRLVYAEIVEIDTALVGGPSAPTGTVIEE